MNNSTECRHKFKNHTYITNIIIPNFSKISFLIVCFILLSVRLSAQGISPIDKQEEIRFKNICNAVSQKGYANPIVVTHGDSLNDEMFFILATTKNKTGVLLLAFEAKDKFKSQIIELENANTPAGIGFRGVSISKFLDIDNLIDISISHQPFMLETSSSYELHHLIRLKSNIFEKICEFPGNSSSTSSKGMRSVTNTRSITIEKISDGDVLRYKVKTTDKSTEQIDHDEPVVTSESETTKEYELPPTGSCIEH